MLLKILFLTTCLSYVLGQTVLDECGPCRPEDCSHPSDCAAGIVKDKCGCCSVCGLREGEKCDNYTLPLPYKDLYGTCGDNMLCLLRKDLTAKEVPEALCVCKTDIPVCGSDGVTYNTLCKLREEAFLRNQELSMTEWGPCKSAPIISSGPDNSTGNLGDNLALSCESRGFPIPSLRWEFTSPNGKQIKLPSDDQMLAVQVRGGPEAFMITSWIQIMELQPSDAGTYTCVASNSLGETRASATVGVYKVNLEQKSEAKATTGKPSPSAGNPSKLTGKKSGSNRVPPPKKVKPLATIQSV